MEKKLKIGFVGTPIRMKLIRQIVPESFPEISVQIHEDSGYLYDEKLAEVLRKMKKDCDGIIFGGETQMLLYRGIIEPEIPCLCIRKDSVSLMNSLLTLAGRGIDISRVSIDNYSHSAISKVFSDAGVSDGSVISLKARMPETAEYYEELYQAHRQFYLEKKVDACITTLIFVHERLEKENIPVVYSHPTTDNVMRTVEEMKHECYERSASSEGILAVLSMHLFVRDEILYEPQPVYHEQHEKLKAADEICYFADTYRGSVIQQSENDYMIIMTRRDFMSYSHSLESIPLLDRIKKNTGCHVHLGMGFGYNPGEACSNASRALRLAGRHESDATYISHNADSISGPLVLQSASDNDQAPSFSESAISASGISGISMEKLYQISQISRKSGKNLFTTAEVATHMGLSHRAAARLLSSLEENGLAEIAGQSSSKKAGRPQNLYRLLIES